MSTTSACCSPEYWPEVSWKLPTLSSVPAGMADGSIVIAGLPGGVSPSSSRKRTNGERALGARNELVSLLIRYIMNSGHPPPLQTRHTIGAARLRPD